MRKLAIHEQADRALAELQSPHSAMKWQQDVNMTDTASPTRVADLTDAEILSLYLSLPPALREKAFINTAHAAEITGVSMRTIQLWIESGAVRAIVIGRRYRIVLESLRAHLVNQMNKCGD